MEVMFLHLLVFLPLLVLLLRMLFHKLSKINNNNKLPPSPPSLPIIGHLHYLRHPVPLHQALGDLAKTYGSVFFLRLGARNMVVVSSLQVAEECFTKNDIILANRPNRTAGKYFGYNYTTITSSPYGEHWRNLRKVSAIEIFSTHRLNVLMGIRRDEIRRFVTKLSVLGSRDGYNRVELQSKLSELTFNILMRMVAGKRYFGDDAVDDEESKEFRYTVKAVVKNGGAANLGEFLPILRWVGYGFDKRMIRLFEKTDAYLQGMIDEHRRKKINGTEIKDTMIDHLLGLQETEPDYYTDQIIKGLIMVVLLAGTDTTSVTIEWAMSFLVNHPNVLKKMREEIDAHIGQDQLIGESDVLKLNYLQNIIWETLRLKPAAPLLVPHRASEDCRIAGYHVPRSSMLIVNACVIHRDPNLWDDPTSFKPERFESDTGELNKDAHKLILPFGLGRRACPGAALAQRVVGLTLGSLIHCFDWKRVSHEPVDLSEGKGVTMPKAMPLEAMCRARPLLQKLILEESITI